MRTRPLDRPVAPAATVERSTTTTLAPARREVEREAGALDACADDDDVGRVAHSLVSWSGADEGHSIGKGTVSGTADGHAQSRLHAAGTARAAAAPPG